MSLDLIPASVRHRYRFEQREHACSILAGDFADEWKDILDCLKAFTLCKSYIVKGGGGRSDIPMTIDGFLKRRGWSKKRFDIQVMVDGKPYPTPTYEIDNFSATNKQVLASKAKGEAVAGPFSVIRFNKPHLLPTLHRGQSSDRFSKFIPRHDSQPVANVLLWIQTFP